MTPSTQKSSGAQFENGEKTQGNLVVFLAHTAECNDNL